MQLRPYQSTAIERLYTYFDRDGGNPLIVIPTGGGKSLVIAEFIRRALIDYPGTRVLVLTHVKELIEQNYREMIGLWRDCPAGIYSASVGRRDLHAPVLFAGIQSIHKKALQLGRCDLVLVDEAHLIPRSGSTMYGRFLAELSQVNPYAKVVGFTATPYRLGQGLLTEGNNAVFNDIAFEVSVRELIDNGWLSPLITRPIDANIDTSAVAVRGGEFVAGELERAADAVTEAAVAEIVRHGQDRRGWLAFCAGVDHANHVAEAIRAHGISAETVTGATPKAERERLIEAFKSQRIRCLTNANVLTTGFNARHVDLLAMLRPTQSTGLYIQMAGRGTRLCDGKTDCLVLDFAGNIDRHGPIDAVKPRRPGRGGGDAPVKYCPPEDQGGCGHLNFAGARYCVRCDYEFQPPDVQIEAEATTAPILSTGLPAGPQWLNVNDVRYHRHEKPGKPPSLRVVYQCGLAWHSEWVCVEHDGYARSKAVQWWQKRAPAAPVPNTVAEALGMTEALAVPRAIAVRPAGQYIEIVGAKL